MATYFDPWGNPYTSEVLDYPWIALPTSFHGPSTYQHVNQPSNPHVYQPGAWTGAYTYSGAELQYTTVDDLRRTNDLFDFIQQISSRRRRTALSNALRLKVIEEESNMILSWNVSKKMLILFLGRNVVSQYLRTLERDELGNPTRQYLSVPQHWTSTAALKIMVGWMCRACVKPENLRPMTVPNDLFVAISLAQTLHVFGCELEAQRVDHILYSERYNRPVKAHELRRVWNMLPEDSRYPSEVVEIVKDRLAEYMETEDRRCLPEADAIMEFIEEQPALRTRFYC
jgi:hypothetical protein